MEQFKNFKLPRAVAGENKHSPASRDPLGCLKAKASKKKPAIRKGLVEELYKRASAGESLRLSGYPGSGKSTVLAGILDKSFQEEPCGLSINVYHHLGGYHLDMAQMQAVWALIDGGYKPRFLAIDDATELVPALQKTMAGKWPFVGVEEYLLLLDILKKLPDSVPLVISFPSIHPSGEENRRQDKADFFGKAPTTIIPSVLQSKDFARLFDFTFESAFGRKVAQTVRKNGLCKKVADYLGLYDGNVSTILLRWILWPTNLSNLSNATNAQEIAAAAQENRMFEDFVFSSRNGLTISYPSVRAAVLALDGDALSLSPHEIRELAAHGIVLDAKFLGKDTLTYRAFRKAVID